MVYICLLITFILNFINVNAVGLNYTLGGSNWVCSNLTGTK